MGKNECQINLEKVLYNADGADIRPIQCNQPINDYGYNIGV